LDTGDVAAEADRREIDDGVDAARLQLPQPLDGLRDLGVFVPDWVVVVNLGRQHEHVLVHEHSPEVAGVDRTAHSLDLASGSGRQP